MSHMVGKEAYKSLEERLNKFPQGAPPSETLYKILSLMFTEEEAALVSLLPFKAFNIKTASKLWKKKQVETERILDTLASKALILDLECEADGEKKYLTAPPMAGFFEFALMRIGGYIDQKILSELLHQYLDVEDDFVRQLFWGTETKMGRAFVQERALDNENSIDILDYEKTSHILKEAKHISVSTCYCRHRAHHLGDDCYAPMETCISFDNVAYSLVKHNKARKIDASEALEIVNMAVDHNLVQCGENVQNKPTFLCNCCKCHCEAFMGARKFGLLVPMNTTNYIPVINEDKCVGCGKCTLVCPMTAINVDKNNMKTINNRKFKVAKLTDDLCLGCGVCVKNCPTKAITLKRRPQNVVTPTSTIHRVVISAIEKGQLQNLIFNNNAYKSHKAMAGVIGAILKSSPVHKFMASKQMKSVYLANLLAEK